MRPTPLRITLASLMTLVAVAIWFFPSDVAALVARHRDVLLGRYGIDRFTAYLVLTPLLLWLAFRTVWPSPLAPRYQVFKLVAVTMSVVVGLAIVEIGARILIKPRYQEQQVAQRTNWPSERQGGKVRTRPPQTVYEVAFVDEPDKDVSYPTQPPGYPTETVRLSTDKRGYRNQTDLAQYDIIALGDSFTEGSRVDDTQAWPVLISQSLDRTVYNLAISGVGPLSYLAGLEKYGLDLKPTTVVCMLYEGNDFRGDELNNPDELKAQTVGDMFKGLFIINRTRGAMVKYLAPINANQSAAADIGLSWQPVAIPEGANEKYYAFRPKRLLELRYTRDEILASKAWQNTAIILDAMIETARKNNIRLIFAYAPSKAHVVMPLLKERLSTEALYAFASYRNKGLPPADQFQRELYTNIHAQEAVVADHFKKQGIEFVSTTAALQQRMAAGEQVYFTYDKHWSPLGQAVAAEVIGGYLKAHPVAPDAVSPTP